MPLYRKVYENVNTPSLYHTREGYVGTEGSRHGNNFFKRRLVTSSNGNDFPANNTYQGSFKTADIDRVTNRAIAKFRDEVGSKASNLTALAEANKSLEMITKRALQMLKAAREIRQGRLLQAARTLAIPVDVTRDIVRRVSKKHYFSSMWMEYWLGWAPMLGDIYTSLDVLQRPFPSLHIQVGGTSTLPIQFGSMNKSFFFVDRRIETFSSWLTGTEKCSVGLYGDVEVTNSNLFLASQLGLTNPALTAWDLVPFSFVVNWFVPVSAFLANMDLCTGVKLTRTGVTKKFTGNAKIKTTVLEVYGCTPSGHGCKGRSWLKESTLECVDFTRQPQTLPRSKLTAPRIPKMSVTRAATSISLLVVFLKA